MTLQPPPSFATLRIFNSSLVSPSRNSSTTATQRRRSWRHHVLTLLFILGLLLSIHLTSNLVDAQSSGSDGSSTSPPAPQPGSNPNNQNAPPAPSGDPFSSSSPKAHDDSNKGHDSITASATITSSETPPKPTTITTVSVINGTTTTLTLTIMPTQAVPAANAQPPPPTSLPKAPQSILVIQSISYGKVLPAAGPVDDMIESHFWDQFVPRDPSVKASDGSLSPVWSGSRESRTMILTALMVILVVGLLSH